MVKIKSLFINCSQATHCCDKAQYKEASLFEKIKIHLHIFFCKPCKEYTDKNNQLTALVKKANLKSCTDQEKKMWKEKIERETLNK